MAIPDSEAITDRLAFSMHPRVFAALGRDLVTNDVVAVIELVKNSYDAFATRVDVRFGSDVDRGPYLEVVDNGQGMSREVLEEVWCVVATPHRQVNNQATRGGKKRLVTGDKGLGRLSSARLGDELRMVTKTRTGGFLQIDVDWTELLDREELSHPLIR